MTQAEFFAGVRTALFDGKLTQAQVDGIIGIFDAFDQVGDGRAKTLAYALATAHHETGRRMVPVREGFASSDAAARAMVRRAGRRYAAAIPPHGQVYYGRGHVQLTWADNYKRSSADAGVDLFADPDRMLDPRISARILILGLLDGRWNGAGKGIAHYLPAGGRDDLQNARRTVNITDRWQEIGGFYTRYLAAIEAAGGIDASAAPAASPAPASPPDEAQDLNADGRLHALAEWRAAAPAAALAETAAWLGRMPA